MLFCSKKFSYWIAILKLIAVECINFYGIAYDVVEFDFSKVYITISVHVLVDTLLNYFNQITIL